MRAIINTPGGPSRVALETDLPEPAAASDEVVVEVEAFSLNRGELALLDRRPAGWRPGQDIAGTVVRPARDGSGPAVGSRVVALIEGAGWAERAPVPVGRLAVLPPGLEVALAASLGMAGRTALRTVALGGSLLGARVLVTGAAGGVGTLHTQLSALAGAEVVAVTRRDEARDRLLGSGAAAVVADPREAAGLFDLVLDGVGGEALGTLVAKVAPEGTIVLVGASAPGRGQVGLLDFMGHENATIKSDFSYAQPENVAQDLAALVQLLAAGRIAPRLGFVGGWEKTDEALESLAAGQVDGKAVLLVG